MIVFGVCALKAHQCLTARELCKFGPFLKSIASRLNRLLSYTTVWLSRVCLLTVRWLPSQVHCLAVFGNNSKSYGRILTKLSGIIYSSLRNRWYLIWWWSLRIFWRNICCSKICSILYWIPTKNLSFGQITDLGKQNVRFESFCQSGPNVQLKYLYAVFVTYNYCLNRSFLSSTLMWTERSVYIYKNSHFTVVIPLEGPHGYFIN